MEYRLPTDVSPTHYNLTLLTDLPQHKFRGAVEIDLKVNAETSKIVLNTADLQLSDVSVTIPGGEEAFVPVSHSTDKINQRSTFVFPSTFAPGVSLRLFIMFEGRLGGNLIGYYEGTWEAEGKKNFYTVTQFEPTAARRAFPCWDEPALKATFVMSMISDNNSVNIFNTPAASEEPYTEANDVYDLLKDSSRHEWKITRFETSPLMSTYIVAYANGQFEYIESSFTSPISEKTRPIRVYASPSSIHQAKYALEVTGKVLPVYEELFDIEYPLPKLDTLVVQDLDAYAMENWGLITGRAGVYLLDPNTSNLQQKQAIVSNQVHEIAHMWFGNITTMEWWTYLYLNEELIIPVFPEWKLDSAFIVMHVHEAMMLDKKLSSHPVEVDCPDANKINQIFDSLSYSKAASVLRMLANHVGVEAFLKGVSIYLKAHLYGNSITSDLWDGIEEATAPGLPVITVTESDGVIYTVQDRFLQKGTKHDTDTIWNVPLNILTTDSEGKPAINNVVLKDRSNSYAVDTRKPFKLNARTFGYYRVLYTPERLRQIGIEAIKSDSIFDVRDRLGLVQDAFALAGAQLASLSSALDLLTIFKDTREYYVWASVSTALEALATVWWENEKVTNLLNAFRRFLFKPIVSELGYQYSAEEHPDISLLRTCAIVNASKGKDEEVITELRARFKRFQTTQDRSMIPEELQESIYIAAVEYGGEEEYLTMKGIIENPNTPTEQIAAIKAMCSVNDTKLGASTIEYMSTKARDQDVMQFIWGLMKNLRMKRQYIKHLKENYDAIYEKFKDGFGISGVIQTFGLLTTKEDYEDTKAFFADGKDISRYALSVPQVLDSIQESIVYIENSTDDLLDWLESWKKGQ
ncbi:leucyl aminopeptidase [Rhodocollybia butyracea]|uniref:Aminopeptidase n=1 Tax=Rhodocollybia butyracea TaxID=206335 RepID=A0A9P5UFJ4_9AGAR|nr:leucyl aminopeptidase [Rhodocollybia butyracea]